MAAQNGASSQNASPAPQSSSEKTGSGSGTPRSATASNASSQVQSRAQSPAPQAPQPPKADSSANGKPSSPAPAPTVPFEQWQDRTISEALRVSLSPVDEEKNGCTYLKELAEDLAQEDGTKLLSVDAMDQVLWYRLTETKCLPAPFDYLWSSWTRAVNGRKLVKAKDPERDRKLQVLNDIQSFCLRYTTLITTTDMVSADTPQQTADRLIAKAYSGSGPWDFLAAVVEMAAAEETLIDFLNPVMTRLSQSLAKVTYSGDYKAYLLALETILSSKAVAAVFTKLDGFAIPDNASAPTIASTTLLGPFLALSPLDQSCRGKNFPTPDILSPRDIQRYSGDIESEYHVVLDRLFQMCNRIVRGSVESRMDLMRYFGKVLDMNHKRVAIHVTPDQVSPDGFMFNITYVLVKLSEPFSDMFGAKMDKINLEYFRHKDCVVDISDETKIQADQEAADQYFANKSEEESNFITHAFFLTVGYVHYGNGGLIQQQTTLKRLIDDHRDKLARLELELERWKGTSQEPVVRSVLDRLKNYSVELKSSKLTVDSVLYDQVVQKLLVNFTIFTFMVLIRAAEPAHTYPVKGQDLKLPFPDEAPMPFRTLPEYTMESGLNYLLFLLRYMPQEVVHGSIDKVLVFCVTFLTNTTYVKNPYLKSKLVEFLFFGALENMQGGPGFMVHLFDTDPVSLEHLLHALMKFYIEVEQTGTSSQFYDKFNSRHYISRVIKVIWANNRYRDKLEKESKEDVHFFVQFVALLLNDATYLFDESLAKLAEIHNLQKEVPAIAPADEDQAAAERRQNLASAERQATSYMQLTNESVDLLQLFTSAIPKAFSTPEIVDRLAAMMDYNLAALVGPKCGTLKVQNPEKYFFNPRELLSVLCEVYLNLQKEEQFLKAVARDGRSFDPRNFERAHSILSKWALKPADKLDQWKALTDKAVRIKNEDEEGELELGEVPDEFLDPLMFTLMEEPVTLPSSKVTIDLGTIKSHLLNDPKDPFNRAPLKIEDVVPNTELKQQIEDFKKQRRQEFLKAKEAKQKANEDAEDEGNKMDTD